MTVAKWHGVFTLICVVGLASSAPAEEQPPWFGRCAAAKCQDGMSRARKICASTTAAAFAIDRRDFEEFAFDAYFSLLEFKEDFDRRQLPAQEALAGENAEFFFDRGRVRAGRGEYDAAISDFNACLRLAPDSAMAYFARGNVRGEKKEYRRGIRDLDRCLRIEPRAAGAHGLRGAYWLTLDDADRALDDFDDFVRFDASATAHFWRALAWVRKSEWSRAKADLGRALRLEPEIAVYHVMLGNVRLSTRDDEGAIEAFNGALELAPDLNPAHAGRALAWARMGKSAKAAEDAARAGGLARRLADKPVSRGHAVRLQVKIEGNKYKYWLTWKGPATHDANAYRSGPLYVFSGDARGDRTSSAGAADGGQDFGAAPSDSSDRPSVVYRKQMRANELNTCAWELATSGDALRRDGAKAVAAAREACELTYWNDAACLDTLAAAYAEQEDFESAEKHQKQALQLWPVLLDGRRQGEERLKLYQTRQPYREGAAEVTAYAASQPPLSEDEQRAKDLNDQAWHWATARYAAHRDGVKAVEAAREACELTHWKDTACLDTLAAAYAECGDFESADKYQTWALEAWPKGKPGRQAAERRHALYRDRQPFHPGE